MDHSSINSAATAVLSRSSNSLHFRPLQVTDVDRIARVTAQAGVRTCDFTVGGVMLWDDYFRYRMAVDTDGTVFISGVTEDNVTLPAFSVPMGARDIDAAIDKVIKYCRAKGMVPRFSAVPEEMLPSLAKRKGAVVTELIDFADYLYDIEALATLTGKKLAKKRNHVNRFTADHPDYIFEPISEANLPAVKDFYKSLHQVIDSPSALYEATMTGQLLESLDSYPFSASLLRTPERVVAFTIGEVVGDTLHVHIEKMDHTVDGAGPAINKLFAARMLQEHPGLRYVNRQDDAGDPGLRAAKQSYHPLRLLKKYNVAL